MILDEASAQRWLRARPDCDSLAWEKLRLLVSMLAQESGSQNLISASSSNMVWRRHVADSAQLLDHVPRETSSWLDIGSGAGFPGLIIAMLDPAARVHLVESRPLRSAWLRRASTSLNLANVTVWPGSIETTPLAPASVISARAFAPLDRLVHIAARFSTPETTWVLPKGRSAGQELTQLRGWEHMFHVEPSLTDPGAGIIVGQVIGRKRRRA